MTRRDPTVPASRLIALTAFALVVTTATSAIAQTTGRIEGTITDSRTRQPLGAASVFIQGTGIGTQTNERGRYVLVNVPSGRYEVRVRRIGYQQLSHMLYQLMDVDHFLVRGMTRSQQRIY